MTVWLELLQILSESHTWSPVSNIGCPPGCYVPYPPWHGESEGKRWKIVCNFLLCKETLAQLSELADVI